MALVKKGLGVGLGGQKGMGKATAPGQVKKGGVRRRAIGKAIGKATAPGQVKKLIQKKKGY